MTSILEVITQYFKREVSLPLPSTKVEKAVAEAENKATDIATKVAKIEGKIDPLRQFIEELEKYERRQHRLDGSSHGCSR